MNADVFSSTAVQIAIPAGDAELEGEPTRGTTRPRHRTTPLRHRPARPPARGDGRLESDDGDAEEALRDFRRFPSWMWRNTDVQAGTPVPGRELGEALPRERPAALRARAGDARWQTPRAGDRSRLSPRRSLSRARRSRSPPQRRARLGLAPVKCSAAWRGVPRRRAPGRRSSSPPRRRGRCRRTSRSRRSRSSARSTPPARPSRC